MSARNSERRRELRPGSIHKIYRAPPTPPPEVLLARERSFTLDSVAVSSISNDYGRTNPKLGPAIPPYNARRDYHSSAYFDFIGVKKTLKKFNQGEMGPSIEGPIQDRFYNRGPATAYLKKRNQYGAGHSNEVIDGHAQFLESIRPVIGYNGLYGYRRNTPHLRLAPMPFRCSTASAQLRR